MKSNKCIIPECYVDSCLVEVLLQADRKNLVNHAKSNGSVAVKMDSEEFSEEFCIGIIDEDRKKLAYLEKFQLKIETKSLKLWKYADTNDTKKHHYLIQIRPVIESWILDICGTTGIDLASFPLPRDVKSLMKITKSIAARSDDKMIRLFKLMVKMECEPVLQLRQWITYLKEKNFDADINDLKNA